MTPFQKKIVDAHPGNWITDATLVGLAGNHNIAFLYLPDVRPTEPENVWKYIISVESNGAYDIESHRILYWHDGTSISDEITEYQIDKLVRFEIKHKKLKAFR